MSSKLNNRVYTYGIKSNHSAAYNEITLAMSVSQSAHSHIDLMIVALKCFFFLLVGAVYTYSSVVYQAKKMFYLIAYVVNDSKNDLSSSSSSSFFFPTRLQPGSRHS